MSKKCKCDYECECFGKTDWTDIICVIAFCLLVGSCIYQDKKTEQLKIQTENTCTCTER
jgi:hypothetical protein